MTSYVAVTTTGIYCRPDCTGNPLERNVRRFSLPAAAEAAGYRACLRCRPYRTDAPLSWAGPELVCRAVRLVVDGALDGGTEQELGARLGVSARHLRRLFEQHVGLTPDQLARSRRAHFARRLLDDTDLGVAEIAFAAGFGSVRQMNRTCREVFRAAPSELRARRRRADRLVADGGLVIRLPYAGPLDLDATYGHLAARAVAGVEVVDGRSYRRTVLVDGDPGVIEVEAGDTDHLLLRAHLPHWEGLIHVVGRVRSMLGLDLDPDEATGLVDDQIIGRLVAARPGVRVPGTWDPFEACVRAVVSDGVTPASARTGLDRLVARTGRPVDGLAPLGLERRFPDPADVLAVFEPVTAEPALAEPSVTRRGLGDLGIGRRRLDALHGLAAAVAAGLRLDAGSGLDRLVADLVAAGVGPSAAQHAALLLGEPDAFPAGDVTIRRSLGSGGTSASAGDTARAAAAWSPWRARAASHLWAAAAPPRR